MKAVRLIRENAVIGVPGEEPRETVAYKIAVQAVPSWPKRSFWLCICP